MFVYCFTNLWGWWLIKNFPRGKSTAHLQYWLLLVGGVLMYFYFYFSVFIQFLKIFLQCNQKKILEKKFKKISACMPLAIMLLAKWFIRKISLRWKKESESCSVVSDSLQPHGLYSPWNSPGQKSRALLHGIFPTQGLNPGLPNCRWIPYHVSHQGSPQEKDNTKEKKSVLNH